MSIQVKLVPETGGDCCEECGEPSTFLVSFNVFAEGGNDKTKTVCSVCLHRGVELSALIELPDLSPGRRPPSRRIKKRTEKEEYELAALTGGKRQKGSGSLPHLKGDFHKKGVYRGESKSCFSKSPSWTLNELTKIRSEAAYGEVPVLVTTFMDKSTHHVLERWATIPFESFQEKFS